MDLETGARIVLSDSATPDAGNLIESATGIALDGSNDRIPATDSIIGALLAAHPESGQRGILSK